MLGDLLRRKSRIIDAVVIVPESLLPSIKREDLVCRGNALRMSTPRPGAESGFVFVDPVGFLAEPAYDLGVMLRDWCPQLLVGDAPALARGYCRLFAAETDVDETAIWEWGFLERVSTGLYTMQFASPALYRPFLETAERRCQ